MLRRLASLARPLALTLVSALVVALAAATASWTVILLVDSWLVREEPAGLSALRVALRLSLLAALLATPALLLLRASLLAALKRSPLIQGLAVVVLAALALVPAMDQASFLVSGDGISGRSWVLALQIAFVVVIDVALVALMLLHVRLTSQAARTSGPAALLWRLPVLAVLLAAVLATALLFALVAVQLQAYEYLAVFLTVPLWIVSATLALLAFSKLPRRLLFAALVVVVGLGSVAFAPQDASSVLKTRTAGFTRLLLGMNRADKSIRLDLSKPDRFRCRPPVSAVLPEVAAAAGVRNVILISVDALRRDMLRATTADGRPLTPNMRAFAEQGVDFANAQTTYPATVFSVGGALTGLSPSQILFSPTPADTLFRRTRSTLPRQHVMLPESDWFKTKVIDTLFLQGTKPSRKRSAATQTKAFIKQLKRARRSGERTFAWLHYFDPHAPYQTHKGHSFGEGEREKYLSEVSYLDRQLGHLLKYLRTDGWYDDTLVILFSDHGQALGERGYFGHHVYLEGFITNIVLAMRAPALSPRQESEIVSITDVMPTVLHALGLEVPDDIAGRSLFLPPLEDRHVVAEAFPVRGWSLFRMANAPIQDLRELKRRLWRVQRSAKSYEPKASIVTASHRFIASRASGDTELYRRTVDDERRVRDAPDVRDALMRQLGEWHRQESERIYCRVRNAL